MSDIEQMRDRFVQLRQDGHTVQEALQLAKMLPGETAMARHGQLAPEGEIEVAPTKSVAQAAGLGAAQGATVGFGDEVGGLVQAVGNRVLPESAGGRASGEKSPSFVEDYRQERDAQRAENEEAKRSHQVAYVSSEIGGALATAPLTKVGKGLAGAIKVGAKFGAAAGLGNSKADLTKGEVGGAAADTALGAGIGATAGAVGHGAVKGLGAVVRGVSNAVGGESAQVANAAKGIAQQIAEHSDEPSAIAGETVKSASDKAVGLLHRWSGIVGKPFLLRPSQVAGDRAAAVAESRLSQFPGTMQRAQAQEAEQLVNSGKLLDHFVDNVAQDPAKLGREDIAGQMTQVIKRHISSLYEARSAAAGPLYEAAEKAGGGINADGVLNTIRDQLQKSAFDPAQMNPLLRRVLDEGERRGAGGGLSILEANNLRKLMGQVANRKASLFGGVDMNVQQHMAREIMGSIDGAFDAAAGTSSAPGVQLLRQANAAWKDGSQAIESTATDAVKGLLKMGSSDGLEAMVPRLLRMQPNQVAGVFSILNQTSPAVAQNVRAQLLDEVLVAGGKASRGAPLATDLGIGRLQPQTALNMLRKNEPVLQAAYAGDGLAKHMLKETYTLLQRVAVGPNLKGSQTASLIADAGREVAERGLVQSAELVGGKAASGVVQGILNLVGKITGSGEAAAKAVSSPAGIAAFNKALRIALDFGSGKPVSPAFAAEVMKNLSTAGIDAATGVTSEIRNPPASPDDEPANDEGTEIAQQAPRRSR